MNLFQRYYKSTSHQLLSLKKLNAVRNHSSVTFSLVLLFLFVCIFINTTAQTNKPENHPLSGKVIDQKTKEPLAGATVHIKGTTHEVITNKDGEFSFITAQRAPLIYVISFVGYQQLEYKLEATKYADIELKGGNASLTDVVVIGYGTQRKSDLTGSVATINANTIKQSPVSSFDKILQGTVSGVQVTQTSGQPGSAVTIRIRGGNSIQGGNEPLYVIDGFPVYNDNSTANAGVISGPGINALASLNPGDIESINILKDASATAIYGARGANGVVIITTKKGKAGENTISYDGYYGSQEVIRTLPLLNATQWALLKNDANKDANIAPAFTDEQIQKLGDGTDWQAAAFRRAPIQNHQVTISGGDEKTRYAISGNYYNQDGVLQNTDFDRYSVRLNLDRIVSDKFKTGVTFSASKTSAQVADNSVVSTLLLIPPTVNIYDSTGKFNIRSPYEVALGNPINTLYNAINQTNTYRLLGNFYAEYRIIEGLTAKVTAGADIINNKQNRFLPSTLYEGSATNGSASVGSQFATTWLNENTLNYVTKLGNGNSLNVLVGYTQQTSKAESVIANGQRFVSDELAYNNLGSGSLLVAPASGYYDWSLSSFIGRVNYSIADKYLFTVTGRADGSSRFGENNKWGYFPSAAVAWNAGREGFIKSIETISTLKLRASIGVTGNQEIGQYQSLGTLTNVSYLIGNQLVTGFTPSRIANSDLSWETTTQYDGGFDLGLLRNRINITADLYYKKTTNLLLDVPLPYTSGQASSLQNYGTVQNKGFELSVSSDNIRGTFKWSTNLVFSLNRNKVLSLGNGVDYIITNPLIVKVGEPLGSFYGYKTNGIFQLTDDISKLPTIDPANTKPGDRRYADINGDGIITQADDRIIIGNAQPKFTGGVTNNFGYKGFDLSIFLQGSYGNDLFNQNKQQLELLTGQQNVSITALERWTPNNPGNTMPRAKIDPAPVNNDRFVEDASFLRVKNLTLGYNFPKSITSKLKAKQLRFYVAAQNLVTWTKYTGYDPEVSTNGQSTLLMGIDYATYPNYKSYLVGLNLTF